ncbi:ABC transporter substrate-binding protein [Desulfococcaceae bacterium HSG9]|nr:ABC transporter substrate-binding protein [Desulfococcaceae bacterium HSG9]
MALSAVIIVLMFSISAYADADTLQIAVIGPLSGKYRAGGQAMLDGVNLCAAEINNSGGIDCRKIEVLAYDDQNSKDIAGKKAIEIARDSNALAVIGHYYSSTSIEGGAIYKRYGIPAITASATAPEVTERNHWYFRVVPDTNLQGRFTAVYTRGVLEKKSVNIVFEQDAYGTALKRSFMNAAREIGLGIKNVWGLDSQTDNVEKIFKVITLELQRDVKPGTLFVALQDHEAAELIRMIRDAGINPAIIGGDAIGSHSFLRKFKDDPLTEGSSARYTNDIYSTAFFNRDIGNYETQQFVQAFKRRFGREPDDMAATYYDAAAILSEAVRQAKLKPDLAQSRQNIRDQLNTRRSIETAYKGVTGRFCFDGQGNAVKSIPFSVYLHNKLISAPTQLTPVINYNEIADLQEQLKQGNILTIDDWFVRKTTVIYTGLDVTEISDIDPINGTFNADFYLWFRNNEPLDYRKIEFLNAAKEINLDDAIIETTADNIQYTAFRIKSDFKETFNFHEYPFDSQTLSIRFRHKKSNSEHLLFVADEIGMLRNKGKPLVRNFKKHSVLASAQEWHPRDIMFFSDTHITDSSLGNPNTFDSKADSDISYSRFNAVTEIKRNAKSYVLKNLIPLFIVILLGYVMLFVPSQGPLFVARMNLGVTALLSAIFLSVNATSQLPNIGYLVALDYMYYAAYAIILSGIVITVADLAAIQKNKYNISKQLTRFGRVFQPLFFLTVIGIFVYLYS